MIRNACRGALALVACAGLGGCYGSWDSGGYYGGYYGDYGYTRSTADERRATYGSSGGVEELLIYGAVWGVVLVIWG
ncbi:MAG: hypothetical protein ACF8R7_05410, partial [Phycisphaerales bacterium JB039]